MIDLHCHVLPGIDDGAPTIDDSIAMLDAYAGLGVRTVVATPHLTVPLDPEYAARIDAAVAEVAPLARQRGIFLARGFEIALAPDSARHIAVDHRLTLAGSDVVMVDLPFTEWPLYADDALFAVQATGYRVLLAHPERYPGIQDDPAKAEDLVARGILLQVTIGSFAGAFGSRARRSAEELLARGLVHILATDAHSAGHRMAAVPAGLARLRQLAGEAQVQRATVEAPASLLNGDPAPAPIRSRQRSWRERLRNRIGR